MSPAQIEAASAEDLIAYLAGTTRPGVQDIVRPAVVACLNLISESVTSVADLEARVASLETRVDSLENP